MTSLPTLLLLGFVLGMRHATDADHVVAVTTIVSRDRSLRGAAVIGSLWGLGHTATVFVVGSAIILFDLVIPPRVGLGFELAVGAMLVLLGVVTFRGGTRRAHAAHGRAVGDRAFWPLRPLTVGIVHGLAGSAAVALLVLGTIRQPGWAVAYLGVFGAGTIAGMVLITTALALPLRAAAERSARRERWLAIAAGALSVALGVLVVYRVGFVDGLFLREVHWTPG
jgi:high-affinity nickel-transport protein